uniref:Uncharacterized protein n=1 Tax=Glossina austeni TaxID=7395 RepID=A0A1A9UKY5_GLOAU
MPVTTPPSPRAQVTIRPHRKISKSAPRQRAQAQRGQTVSTLLNTMPQSVQQATTKLQTSIQSKFRRHPRRLGEVFFEGRQRYRLVLNHHQEWRVIELLWLPPAMRGPCRTRDTKAPRALPRGVHLRCNPVTKQPIFSFYSKADLIQAPPGHRLTDLPSIVRLNAAGLITRMFAEHHRTRTPDRQTVLIDEELYNQLFFLPTIAITSRLSPSVILEPPLRRERKQLPQQPATTITGTTNYAHINCYEHIIIISSLYIQRQNRNNKSSTATGLSTQCAPIVDYVDTNRASLTNGPGSQRQIARGTRALKGPTTNGHSDVGKPKIAECQAPHSAQATGFAAIFRPNSCEAGKPHNVEAAANATTAARSPVTPKPSSTGQYRRGLSPHCLMIVTSYEKAKEVTFCVSLVVLSEY